MQMEQTLQRGDARHNPASQQVWVLEPRLPGAVALARELWTYRRFVKYLGARSLRKLYARTALGRAWIFITPLMPIVLRSLVFGGLIGVTSEGIPYFLFLTVGTVLWDLFSSALMWGTRGLEMNRGVLSRIYIPKVLAPISATAPALLNFGICVCVLVFALLYYVVRDGHLYLLFGPRLLFAVLATVLTVLLALGIGLFTAVWGETARDARFVMSQVLMVWLLMTPVLYPLSSVPPEWHGLMSLNPMAVLIETFKWSLLGIGELNLKNLAIAIAMIAAINTAGAAFFSHAEGESASIA